MPLPNNLEPNDIKDLSISELTKLASDIRKRMIESVSKTGGHLGPGLGVVELTVALHHVFDSPRDKIIWDVGHQSYPHKILTGRESQMETLRQDGGLSGFTKRSESPHDPFGAGHSSTSISAALGMATARDLKNDDFETIAVIGDGAMSAGMAYEAINNAGASNRRLIIILNDNHMSIAPPVGAMSNYLSRLIASSPHKDCNNFFEEMGLHYIGPIDGHDLQHLVPVFTQIRDDKTIQQPILVHVTTEKGHGCDIEDSKEEKLHAVSSFDPATKKQHKAQAKAPSYTSVFANTLTELAKADPLITAITAAMPSGTGLNQFAQFHPNRMFDVGIAEQHAVTFSAGLACEGYKPFCTIYSTFLQRGYDQIIHDVAIQNLPVRFAIDRADYVGADGPTHAGSFDIAFLANLPNFVVMAPADEAELVHMVATAASINDRPSALRYPRGEGVGATLPTTPKILPIGKGRIIKEGNEIAILSLGTCLEAVKQAAKLLEKDTITPTIADARFAKPLDHELLVELTQNHDSLLIVESSAIGSFGAHVLQYLTQNNLLRAGLRVQSLSQPDRFIEHKSQDAMYEEAGLDGASIAAKVKALLS